MKKYIKTDSGYYTLKKMPSDIELKEYYEKKYYQDANGAYEKDYTEEEIIFFNNKLKEKECIINRYFKNDSPKSIIDVGCGEGWAINYFKKLGWEIIGVDFSDFGIKTFNPQYSDCVLKGDVMENIDLLTSEGKKYDIILLDHVFEHVTDPIELVGKIKRIINKDGLLIINVPNDFSMLQNYLTQTGKVDKEYWFAPPDHISYFTRESLSNLLNTLNFEKFTSIGDHPIDINLLNSNSNYVINKKVGKSCYFQKIEIENLLHKERPISKIVNYYESLTDVGLGRSFSSFFSIKNQ